MNLPEFGVKRPITNLMIFCAIIVVSLYSLTQLGVDMMPEIEPATISVISAYPGASPEDVEIRVTEPLENQLASTPGLEKITSVSDQGSSRITLKFRWGTNLDEASNDIRDRIDRSKRMLPDIPDEMDEPFIFKFNTAMIPIVFVGVTADQSYPDLYDMIDQRVADPLRQIPGVGTVQVNGGLERQINIWLDRQRLEGYGFSILEVAGVLGVENVTQPLGNLKSGLTDYLIRLPGEFKSPEEINSVILGRRNGRLIYLRDVARIEDDFKEVTNVVRINGRRGLMFFIQKQTGVNTVQVAESVKKRLAELQELLPPDVTMRVIMDSSQDILRAIASLRSALWSGGLFVIIVTWLFLGRFRPSVIIALTIPFSLLMAFIYLFLSGKTINVISLTSLTIAIGMVVDNAIVVVDNVIRHLDRGQRPRESAVFATREMFLAIAASTGTTIAVFLPLLFVTGLVGIMFNDLAAIVTMTLIASLFTAVTFTPMLCSRWLRKQTAGSGGIGERWSGPMARVFESLERGYANLLGWTLGHRKTVVIGAIAVFASSLLLARFVGSEFMPEEDSGDMNVTAQLPVGTRIEETDRIARVVEEILKKDVPEAITTSVRIGSGGGGGFGGASGSHILTVRAKLVSKGERKRSSRDIAQAIRAKIRTLPGVIKTDVFAGNPMGRMILGTGGKGISLEVRGNSFEETDEVAEHLKTIMEHVPGTVDVSVSRDMRRPEFMVHVNREKAAALGLNIKTIADTLSAAITGTVASRYREGGQSYDINVRFTEESRAEPEDLRNIMIISPYTGRQVRLDSFAEIGETTGPVSIERQNRERIVRVECNAYKRSSGEIFADLQREIGKMTLPSTVAVNVGGEAEEQSKAFADLTLLLLLGLALVYMVMAAQFESLVDPFIVMLAVPFTFTGVIVGFVVTHSTLSVVTYLAIVMLMGIVVNNAIVLISYINMLRARGVPVHEAITTGGKDRLRPVLMTTLTTMAGFLPLAISRGQGAEIWQPMGITMISGLMMSTLITLLFVPSLYSLFEEHRKRGRTQAASAGGAVMSMKMVIVACNEAIDDDVMEALSAAGMVNYTKFVQAYGRGKTSGIHQGDDTWPGLNNVLLAVVPEDVAARMLDTIRGLRKTLGGEGVKAFVLPIEATT